MRTKHIIAIAVVAVAGWMAASHVNGLQAKYEQDVADYTAVLEGDTLPVQARVEAARPSLEVINLAKAITSFRINPANQADLAEAAATSELRRGNMADQLINTAMRFLGVPYRSGQSSPSGFDCSGFTNYVFKLQNIALTRSSRSQYTEGNPVADVADLKKGDLVFFGGSRGGSSSVGHVGIVTEVNPDSRSFKFIHASRSSGIKVDDSKQAYYSRRYVGARRILQ